MVDPRDLGPQLRSRLTYLLKHALIELDGLHRELLAPAGVSARELAVLLLLDAREPESQQQAAQRLGVDRTTMVALLDALEGKDLVVRRPERGPAPQRRRAHGTRSRHARRRATRASDEAELWLLAVLDEDELPRSCATC